MSLEKLDGRHQDQQGRARAQAVESVKAREHEPDQGKRNEGSNHLAGQAHESRTGGEAPRDQCEGDPNNPRWHPVGVE